MEFVAQQDIGMIIVGRTRRPWWYRMFHPSIVAQLLARVRNVDVLIVSLRSLLPVHRQAPPKFAECRILEKCMARPCSRDVAWLQTDSVAS